MNSSANDTFDPLHSSDSDSDGNPGVSSAYVDRPSASSLNATLLVDTKLLATPATSDKIVSDSPQHFFPRRRAVPRILRSCSSTLLIPETDCTCMLTSFLAIGGTYRYKLAL